MARRGFSLLEVMIAATILTLVLGGIYTILIQGSRSMGQGTQRLDAVADLNRAVEALRRDARAIYWRSDTPIQISGTVPDQTLSFSIVKGVSVQGLPVVVPVEWSFAAGSAGGGGSLKRIYSPGLPGSHTQNFFSGQLLYFDVIKYDSQGNLLDPASTEIPSYLECDLGHTLGTSLRLTLFLHSRYQVRESGDPLARHWIPNHRLQPFDPAAPVITAVGGSTTAITLSAPVLATGGGAIVTSGEAMTQQL